MNRDDSPIVSQGTTRVSRRTALRAIGATFTGAAVTSTATAQQSRSEFGGWFNKTENYRGVVDKTDQSTVSIAVGPSDVAGGPYAFAPAAVRVSPGTKVVWKWTGKGGSHNVVANDGSFESKLTSEQGFTFNHTFDTSGIYKYYCTPHKAMGMRGVVIVGDVSVGGDKSATGSGGGGGFAFPGNAVEQTILAIVFGTVGLSVVAALLPDVGPATAAVGRLGRRLGYVVHRRNSFRNRLVGSTLVGWVSFFSVLLVLVGLCVAVWWIVPSMMGYLAVLGMLGVVVILYAISNTGVNPSIRSKNASRPLIVASTTERPRGGPNQKREWVGLRRTLPVFRGWMTVLGLLLGATAGIAIPLYVSRHVVGVLVGILLVVIGTTWYAVSSTG